MSGAVDWMVGSANKPVTQATMASMANMTTPNIDTPTISSAAGAAQDEMSLLRRRRGIASTMLTTGIDSPNVGTSNLLGS